MSIDLNTSINNFNTNFFNVTTTDQANELKQKFFQATGYTSADLSTTDAVKQKEILAKYAQFLAGQLNSLYQIESIIELSPEEIKRRNIMFETFSIVLKMLNALQLCTRALSNTQVFYTKWQKQYTSMMTSIPLYTQSASGSIRFNANDIGKSTFGYGNIRLEDIVKYLTQKPFKTDPEWREFAAGSLKVILVTVPVSNQVELAIQTAGGQTLFSTALTNWNFSLGADDPTNGITKLLYLLQNDYHSRRDTSWYEFISYDELRARLEGRSTTSISGITWSSITSPGSADEDKARMQLRGEANGKLQLMIENARSLKQQVQDTGKPIENLINQTQEAIQNQSQLLSALTESMKGLIAAIFR